MSNFQQIILTILISLVLLMGSVYYFVVKIQTQAVPPSDDPVKRYDEPKDGSTVQTREVIQTKEEAEGPMQTDQTMERVESKIPVPKLEEPKANGQPTPYDFLSVVCHSGCEAPAWIVKNTDQFLIERLGETYFRENLILDSQKAYLLGNKYHVRYIHTTFTQVAPPGNSTAIWIKVHAGTGEILGEHEWIPSCGREPELCEFNVSEEEALATAEAVGLDVNSANFLHYIDYAKNTGVGWAWHLFQDKVSEAPTQRTAEGAVIPGRCWYGMSMEINLTSGKTSDVVIERHCENISF